MPNGVGEAGRVTDWSKERRLLCDEQTRLAQRLTATGEFGLIHSMRDAVSELSGYDQHPADMGTEMFERQKDLSLRQDDRERLEAVQDALSRLDAGTYGVCEACGHQIAPQRLAAEPAARFCIDCQRRADGPSRLHIRPVEEEVLNPPFSRTDMDSADFTGFDGEDSWQALGRLNKRKALGNEMDDDPADDSADYVEPVEAVSNEQYRAQLPD